MEKDTVWVPFDVVEKFVTDVFKGLGVPGEEASLCADVLVAADRRGIHSHGVARLKSMYYDRIRAGVQSPVTRLEIVREGPTTAVIDGHDGMGQVISKRAMDMAIAKAREFGTGMLAVRNSTHFGIAGYYVSMAVNQGMIGIAGSNARPSVAPTFGVESMLGTNPLAFGIPTDEEFPFILDCATSLTHRGRIEAYARENKEIPVGWVIGPDGRPRTDTCKILKDLTLVTGKAALTPLGGIGEESGGHKGYGYATVVEILSAALQGGSFLRMLSGLDNGKKVPCHLGHFFIAIDVSSFTDLKVFKKTTGDILRALRASRKAPGQSRIYTAGEKEYLAWLQGKDKGVPIDRKVQNELVQMRDELGLDYEFCFPKASDPEKVDKLPEKQRSVSGAAYPGPERA